MAGGHNATPAPDVSPSAASVCGHGDDFLQWRHGKRKRVAASHIGGLQASDMTTMVIFNMGVAANGDFTYGGTICSHGGRAPSSTNGNLNMETTGDGRNVNALTAGDSLTISQTGDFTSPPNHPTLVCQIGARPPRGRTARSKKVG